MLMYLDNYDTLIHSEMTHFMYRRFILSTVTLDTLSSFPLVELLKPTRRSGRSQGRLWGTPLS